MPHVLEYKHTNMSTRILFYDSYHSYQLLISAHMNGASIDAAVYFSHCRGDNLELVTYLVEQCQLSINTPGQHKWTPLHYACV